MKKKEFYFNPVKRSFNGNKSFQISIFIFYLYFIYYYLSLACRLFCLYPINVKTAEPIRPKFFVETEIFYFG